MIRHSLHFLRINELSRALAIVKLLDLMGMKFRGLMMMDMFVDT